MMPIQQNNKKKKAVTKTDKHYLGDYFCVSSFRMYPVNEAFLEKLAMEFVAWSKLDTSLKLEQFYELHGFYATTFERWCDRCELLREAKEFVTMVIGTRRELGGLYKKLDASIVLRSLPMYDKKWRQREIEYAALSKTDDRPSNVTVILDTIGETPEVTQRLESIKEKEWKKKALASQ